MEKGVLSSNGEGSKCLWKRLRRGRALAARVMLTSDDVVEGYLPRESSIHADDRTGLVDRVRIFSEVWKDAI